MTSEGSHPTSLHRCAHSILHAEEPPDRLFQTPMYSLGVLLLRWIVLPFLAFGYSLRDVQAGATIRVAPTVFFNLLAILLNALFRWVLYSARAKPLVHGSIAEVIYDCLWLFVLFGDPSLTPMLLVPGVLGVFYVGFVIGAGRHVQWPADGGVLGNAMTALTHLSIVAAIADVKDEQGNHNNDQDDDDKNNDNGNDKDNGDDKNNDNGDDKDNDNNNNTNDNNNNTIDNNNNNSMAASEQDATEEMDGATVGPSSKTHNSVTGYLAHLSSTPFAWQGFYVLQYGLLPILGLAMLWRIYEEHLENLYRLILGLFWLSSVVYHFGVWHLTPHSVLKAVGFGSVTFVWILVLTVPWVTPLAAPLTIALLFVAGWCIGNTDMVSTQQETSRLDGFTLLPEKEAV